MPARLGTTIALMVGDGVCSFGCQRRKCIVFYARIKFLEVNRISDVEKLHIATYLAILRFE